MTSLSLLALLHVCGSAGLHQPQITVAEQKADVDAGGVRVVLTLRSTCALPVSAVRVGFLIAAEQSAFTGVDPRRIYAEGAGGRPISIIQQDLAAHLTAQGLTTASLHVALPPGGPKPMVLLSHVLAYTLADVAADPLLDLTVSTAAPDRVAACNAMALTGDAAAKDAAGLRWQATPDLATGLAAALVTPVPDAPTYDDVARRVFAARALGVLGVVAPLHDVMGDPNLANLDPPLQVLRAAQADHADAQVPLAAAVPPNVQHFAEVVEAALADARTSPAALRQTSWHWVAGSALVCLALFVSAAVAARRKT